MRGGAILIASSFVFRIVFCDRNHILRAHAYCCTDRFWWRGGGSPFCPRRSSIRSKLHGACTWVFSRPSSIGTCQTWKDVLHSGENRQKECIGVASVITLACSDFARPGLGPRAMCVAMNIFGSVLSNAGCPWIMLIASNFWRSHSRRYCPEDNSTTNDIHNDSHYSKILTETTMMPSNISKLPRVDFCCPARNQHSEWRP